MTTDEAAAQIQAQLGPMWPRDRSVPREILAPLCEALWQEGINPNRRLVQQRLPIVNDHAVGTGLVAWRKQKGLPELGVPVSPALPTNFPHPAKIITSPLSYAPSPCLYPPKYS